MKKIRLLLLAFGLLMAIVSSGQTTLTFKFANPRIVHYTASGVMGVPADADYFEFDIQAKALAAGTYIFSGQAVLNFNNSALSTSSTRWLATPGALLQGLFSQGGSKNRYDITWTVTGSPSVINVQWNASSLNTFATDYLRFNTITTSYQTLVTVSAQITDPTAIAGINFIQSSMNNQQSYKLLASPWNALYSNPNNYDPANFLDTYLGRVYSSLNSWSQVGGSTDAVQYFNWGTSVNTSVWDGTAAAIPPTGTSLASAVRIHSGATLTIPPTGQLTAASIENNTANGLAIQSDATGTGSLIVGSVTGSGTAVAQRYMTTGAWHQVSPPLAGQTVIGFLTESGNSTNIANKSGNRGMMNYITGSNAWSSFYTNVLGGGTGPLAAGQGYMMRTDFDAAVNFGGNVTTGSPSLNLSGAGDTGWNLIGNPFTSAISINNAADATSGFMAVNAGSLDASNVGVYFWNQTSGVYDVINNANITPQYATLGQAFFVKSKTANAAISFPTASQVHQNGVVLKSANEYPEIKLIAANDGKNASTSIKFISGTSKGLDPGYDAGIFKLDASVSLYTKLVEDNGVQFMLQCLPDNNYSSMIIPVGIDSKAGGQVVFSAEAINLSGDCKVILEDKLLKKFTDLSKNDYTVTVAANSSITDRFQIHTSYQTTGLDVAGTSLDKLSAYAIRNTEIKLKGQVSRQAVATLYDIQGRVIVVKNLEEGNLNSIPTPNIKTGIYMLFVKDNGRIQSIKVPVSE